MNDKPHNEVIITKSWRAVGDAYRAALLSGASAEKAMEKGGETIKSLLGVKK